MSSAEGKPIDNEVHVFFPDSEQPEKGTELWAAENLEAAKRAIDERDKEPMEEVLQASSA